MDDAVIQWILSDIASMLLASFAFFLMLLYLLQVFITPKNFIISRVVRKDRLVMRAINWGIFSVIIFLFGKVVPPYDLSLWRATARIALLFLMLPEMAYQITVTWPTAKGIIWKKISHQSSSR